MYLLNKYIYNLYLLSLIAIDLFCNNFGKIILRTKYKNKKTYLQICIK